MPDPDKGFADCAVLLTCEHGGNIIPSRYRRWFRAAQEALQSHRGYDPGALELARRCSRILRAPLEEETRSRLLIELNRSLGHPRLFSEFSRKLPEEIRTELLEQIYHPYRDCVRQRLRSLIGTGRKAGRVIHLSFHSFTPVLNEKTRRTDIGLLFDPSRSLETDFAQHWRTRLRKNFPTLKIHFNLPYRGISDGLTTALRMEFPGDRYAGIELEVNQKFVTGGDDWKVLQKEITASLQTVLNR